jgi:hypothetical protein
VSLPDPYEITAPRAAPCERRKVMPRSLRIQEALEYNLDRALDRDHETRLHDHHRLPHYSE